MRTSSSTRARARTRSGTLSPGTCAAARVTSTSSRRFSTRPASWPPRLDRRRTMASEHAPRTSAEVGGMGHSLKRKEDPRFIRGQGTYVDDVQLPGMLYLDIVRSPYAHAKITMIDTAKALAIPG